MKRIPEADLDYSAEDGLYRHDDQPFTGVAFRESARGWVISEQQYRDGVADGVLKTWYAPDRPRAEKHLSGGVFHGQAREWHVNGQLALEEDHELGVCLHRRRWDADGTLTEDYRLAPTDPEHRTLEMMRRHARRA